MRWIVLFILVACATPAVAKDKHKTAQKDASTSTASMIVEFIKSQKLTEAEKEEQKSQRRDRVQKVLSELEQQGQITPSQKQKVLDACDGKCEKAGMLPGGLKPSEIKSMMKVDEFCSSTAEKVLGDHLDEKDLKALLKFLKTPTGKKLIKQAPDMASEAAELAAARFLPPLMEMGKRFKMRGPSAGQSLPLSPEEEKKRREILDKLKEMLKQREREKSPPEET